MAKPSKIRSGSMAFYPRKRAKTQKTRFGFFKSLKEGEILGFLGYKVGMLHLIAENKNPRSHLAGQDIFIPAPVVETPALGVLGVRAYKKTKTKNFVVRDFLFKNIPKYVKKYYKLPKEGKGLDKLNLDEVSFLRLLVFTQPRLTSIGKKKPEILELDISGNKETQLRIAREKEGKEIVVEEIFEPFTFLDIKAVTKGKGMQGPVKRFGVKVTKRKAQKHRDVGSIGAWSPSTVPFTVPRAGQMGYHTRTEFNKKLLIVGKKEDIKKINPRSGFKNYGFVKNPFIVVAGSIPGPTKRFIAIRKGTRKKRRVRYPVEEIKEIVK